LGGGRPIGLSGSGVLISSFGVIGGSLPLVLDAVLGRISAYESMMSPPDRAGLMPRLLGRGWEGKPRISCVDRGDLGGYTADADEVLRAMPMALIGISFTSGRRGRVGPLV
jgi:hypothetical protein